MCKQTTNGARLARPIFECRMLASVTRRSEEEGNTKYNGQAQAIYSRFMLQYKHIKLRPVCFIEMLKDSYMYSTRWILNRKESFLISFQWYSTDLFYSSYPLSILQKVFVFVHSSFTTKRTPFSAVSGLQFDSTLPNSVPYPLI